MDWFQRWSLFRGACCERLGYSNIGITLDVYSHVMPGMQADVAEQVDVALQAAISSDRKRK
ncbi:hypothetical protein FJ960_01820 [Mesorhizobium sp. B2-3-11]|nr:hypothetical protein FJ960_01820 [Mesorhizobium sp. B2-3-11]